MVDSSDLDPKALTDQLAKQDEWARSVIFDADANIITSRNCQTNQSELTAYLKAYDSRDNTIAAGFNLGGDHFDVHRFHPPLIYGRRGDADNGEGISLARGTSKGGKKVYLLITYTLPIVSARAVPQQIDFFNTHIGELDKF
mmetsp:Transcript_7446/g.6776  ORF Transcript_7446/g.6776 Transcript_7446/m.6776 type:complete len:142 (-) Transcript_7446:217-642(-)|eukprot:CAMPEP_0114589050 /NCGR_PEP_ID=MMETSP0125-20121206/11608_1 /TAXON_ID=485358 ORGANISM="Aristerostoma sp., Strain ATCC 50986" /NCGR_SAMPLE_ID=MMETSP0125 /ASSEMBLY_ACC=CAM_ASM_000245 /LENGTH=141 /DNA_ID=CAMNT_0001785769 /DNA_START=27 /DNA_END=452 /DNA_ORIENTATION=-